MHCTLSLKILAIVATCLSQVTAAPFHGKQRRDESKLVVAHFLMGIVGNYQLSDWTNDITAAQDLGIDGFTLNIAIVDQFNNAQLALAYQAAQQANFKMSISFDFAYYDTSQAAQQDIISKLNTYAKHPAALIVNGGALVTTFIGDQFGSAFPWDSVKSSVSSPLHVVPNYQPANVNQAGVDGALSWVAWPNDGHNGPAPGPLSTAEDTQYINALNGKTYIAPVSPWFFTHYPPNPNFAGKNWVFDSNDLWTHRWQDLLSLNPSMIEIVTWNDFGESHYIGPQNNAHSDDGASAWAKNMPHDSFRTIAKPYIAAFKSGSTSPIVQTESIVYYYRPNPKDTVCSDSLGQPNGYQLLLDDVFVTTILTQPATLIVTSGSNNAVTISVPAGITTTNVPMGLGSQNFVLSRNGQTVLSGTGGLQITNQCTIYNFNAYTGQITGTSPTTPLPTTASPSTGPTPTPPSPPSQQTCIAGTGDGNFGGLCSFSCHYGYCPPGPCTCTAQGTAVQAPPTTGVQGIPIPGEPNEAEYTGLCSFACNHGYCPSGACETVGR